MEIAANDISQTLCQSVAEAAGLGRPLQLCGSGSKEFFGRRATGTRLDLTAHRGVINYEPRELVITVRAGTRLAELESLLAAEGQMLAFEPPHFGPSATLGGSAACGLSGPRRPYAGALRDFVLGVTLINGRGERLRFGGEVMKNVAGYDLSRLMVGAMGSLGLLLDVSLKVLPLPETERTLVQACTEEQAIERMNRLAGTPLPLTGAVYDGLQLYLRLSGSEPGVVAAQTRLGGEVLADGSGFWRRVRELEHPFFDSSSANGPDNGRPLWRLSISPGSPPLGLPGRQFIDWGGAQRWLIIEQPGEQPTEQLAERLRAVAVQHGGHAQLFRGGDRNGAVNHPLPGPLMQLHQQLKLAFDPQGIFNPGRLYPEF
ncbi:glycolate oxidase subunit GlcE [Sedimenticola hydrogenitrophicus]|uniref:glycolate oxidase subunit GlcE n=1 Tax=Sedimenticola hydrogenitrophicus TaxID=2967975 RepID=UPI0023B18B4B|nr:glycolate oxidase subunit GlcE [Sedimenticola hydrogenitrophicus]